MSNPESPNQRRKNILSWVAKKAASVIEAELPQVMEKAKNAGVGIADASKKVASVIEAELPQVVEKAKSAGAEIADVSKKVVDAVGSGVSKDSESESGASSNQTGWIKNPIQHYIDDLKKKWAEKKVERERIRAEKKAEKARRRAKRKKEAKRAGWIGLAVIMLLLARCIFDEDDSDVSPIAKSSTSSAPATKCIWNESRPLYLVLALQVLYKPSCWNIFSWDGYWEERFIDGSVQEGPYVNNKRHGQWTIRHPDGAVETVDFVNDKPQ